MIEFDPYDFCLFIEQNKYPYYYPVKNEKGEVDMKKSGIKYMSRDFFISKGLCDPKNYYLEQIYS